MLKIYLQFFGSIALCVIIFLNYQVFVQKPNREKIKEIQKEVTTLSAQKNKLDEILNFKGHFQDVEDYQFKDYDNVRVFFSDTFNEPRFMGRIQKLIDLSGCTTDGILVGKVTKAAKPSMFEDFVTKPKENLEKNVDTFIETMKTYTGAAKKWQSIVGPDANYSSRLPFYLTMAKGKKYPSTMLKSMDIYRFNLTVKGNYTSCKRFLYLVNRNRPYTQVQVTSFNPVTKDQGPDKQFACRVVVFTYMDKAQKMQSSIEVAAAPKKEPDVKATEPAAAVESK